MYQAGARSAEGVRLYRDTAASAAGRLLLSTASITRWSLAPATSNTVAKFVYGISDNLATNVFAQAGKCRVPSIVFACDTAPELETKAPDGMVKVYPRRIDLENTRRSKDFEATTVVETLPALQAALDAARARARPMAERVLFLTGHLAEAAPRRLLDRTRTRPISPGRCAISA